MSSQAFEDDQKVFEQTKKLPIFGKDNQNNIAQKQQNLKNMRNAQKNMLDIKVLTELNFMMDQFKNDMDDMSEQFRESRYFFKKLYTQIMQNMSYKSQEINEDNFQCIEKKSNNDEIERQRLLALVRQQLQRQKSKKEEIYFVGNQKDDFDVPVWSVDSPQIESNTNNSYGFQFNQFNLQQNSKN